MAKTKTSTLTPHAKRIVELYVNRWDKHVEYTSYSIRAQREQYLKQKGSDVGFAPSYVTIERRLTVTSLNRFMKPNHILCMFASKSGSKFLSFDVDAKTETGEGDLGLSGSIAVRLIRVLIEMGVPEDKIYPSFSGKKGYHVDLFFPKRISNYYMRRIYNEAMNRLRAYRDENSVRHCEVEFTPTVSQAIKLPLSVHKDTGQVAWFVDHSLRPIEDYDFLFRIKTLTAAETDALIELCGNAELKAPEHSDKPISTKGRYARKAKQEPSGTHRHDRMLKMALAAAYKGKQEQVIHDELHDWVVREFGEDALDSREVQQDIRLIPQYALSYSESNDRSEGNDVLSLFSKYNTTTLSTIGGDTAAIDIYNSIDLSLDTRGITMFPHYQEQNIGVNPDDLPCISREQLIHILTARGKQRRLRTDSRLVLFALHMCQQSAALGGMRDGWVKMSHREMSERSGVMFKRTCDAIHILCEAGLLNKCVIEMDPRTRTPFSCTDFHGNPVVFQDIVAQRRKAAMGEIKPSNKKSPIWEKNGTNRYKPLLPNGTESEPRYYARSNTISRNDFYRAAAQLLSEKEISTLLSKGDALLVRGITSPKSAA